MFENTVFSIYIDNSWQNENHSFLLDQLLLYCVPAFLAVAGTALGIILHVAWPEC